MGVADGVNVLVVEYFTQSDVPDGRVVELKMVWYAPPPCRHAMLVFP